nr:hypothetical protein [Enterovibrio nigricans]
MTKNGSKAISPPLWLLAELTYRCPLHCAYCSNPINLGDPDDELSTEEWKRVLEQGRELGAVQLGFLAESLCCAKISKNLSPMHINWAITPI